ncbi:DUF1311 domain-containing protein [Trinickia sp. LjRoot230]|uniref:lysozyme inhibitor LprI family protein n=1 Tax=Trinickia sp. LjRoot230 TaxID=3342288 RepID=UPI003ED096E5
MHAIKWLVLFAALSFSAAANSSRAATLQDERAIREQCSEYAEAGMRDCLDKSVRESEKALNDAERKTLDAISKWDEDAKFIGLAKNKLRSSGKAFTEYRAAQCAFAASLGGGAIGNALDMRRAACVAELNNRRAEQLRSAAGNLPQR